MKNDRTQALAFAISAVLTLMLFGTLGFIWRDQIVAILPIGDAVEGEPDYFPGPEDLSAFTLYFVRTLPLYDQQTNPEVTFVSNQDLGAGNRTLVYRVASTPLAEVTLHVEGWYVVDHQVAIMTPSGNLAVTLPEPNQIVSASAPLTVKGRAQAHEVQLILRDDVTGNALYTMTATVVNNEFSAAFSLATVETTNVTVEAASDGEMLAIPVIVDTYAQ